MTEILKIGDSRLRNQAQKIIEPTEAEIIELAKNLITTAEQANGVGIAAPQIGQSWRVFIVASRPSIRYPHAPQMSPTAMINPVLLSHSNEVVKDWEGCLSVPDVRALVPRYREIEVAYTDIEGKQQYQVLSDFVARIFQHELDHLNGVLFPDRVVATEDLYTEAEYQKLIFQ